MKLVRIVNSTYNEVDRNLRILKSEGVITQRYVGRRRFVRLNFKNQRTSVLLEILKILESSVDLKQLRRSLKRLMENINENGNCLQDLLNLKNSKLQ